MVRSKSGPSFSVLVDSISDRIVSSARVMVSKDDASLHFLVDSRPDCGVCCACVGSRSGDLLLKINDEELTGKANPLPRALNSIRASVRKAEGIRATVKRDGSELELTLPALPSTSASIGVEITDKYAASARRHCETNSSLPLVLCRWAKGAKRACRHDPVIRVGS